MTSDLHVEPAHEEELSIVLSILDDAAEWLHRQGIDQWPASFSRDATWRTDRIRAYIRQGCTYLVREPGGTAVATFTLTPGADPQFAHGWPDGPDVGGYVFRMAVRRSAAGQDLGSRILDWAGREVWRWGRKWLRVDVHRHNPELQAYYEGLGFTRVAEVIAPDLSTPGRIRGSGTLMQRPAEPGEEAVADQYDPHGTAGALIEAANMITQLRSDPPPLVEDPWNTALEQAARLLETEAIRIKQACGMYHRAMGSGD
ncbi:acetyltransferase [Micromonospora sp. ATCC 39149]|uniref:GNAT family N-acetyltransferase n=1 Tax=Micromonospora carbonacea TaxID=47853 RepID=A0A7D5Y7V8_9ACTN|nr:GNAT family N-acetyltransferase [Micromonospora sp. ATCC 39149]EEP71784.1 acetyltransferase [Micromonospora sp. ATCC 39149]QLJ98019.1 GNAT family N-acetyltransferase [Micromonospora carbonacea]